MNKQWNNIIHDRIKDFPKKAPEGLLDDIKSEMLHRGLEVAPVSNKRQPFYYRAVGIAAILLLLFGLGYQWTDRTDTSTVITTIAETEEPLNETTAKETSMAVENKVMAIAVPKTQKQQKEKTSDNVITSNDALQTEEDKPSAQEEPTEKKKSNKEKPVKKKTTDTHPNNLLATTSKRKTSSLAAGISFSGIIAQKKGNSSSEQKINADNEHKPNKPSIPQFTSKKERHHLPIKLGLSLRYNIHERWNIQSGLTYSCLISDFSKGNPNYDYRQTTQKLHYMGIPLQVGFLFWKSSRFNSYIAAGGQAEKLISGKATTSFSVNNEYRNISTEKIHDKRLLFSGLASIGIEYSLKKNFSMYIEPNIQYYFKNGNELKTHYNDKPLNINITAGFRFHWKK